MKSTLIKFAFLAFIIINVFSCRKDPILSDSSAKLAFSDNTIFFDTVFTSIGSATKRIRIYNHNSERVKISTIRLGYGQNSIFRMNVDGTPGKVLHNVEIGAKDSLFLFIEVTVNPNNINTPLVVNDSIIFELNGNVQNVKLIAWGQDAFYIKANKSINGIPYKIIANKDTTWTNTKPIVIYGYAVVDSSFKLTIQAGARIYFHNNGGLWIYKDASLDVNGTKDNPVTFQGDRLEAKYKDIPGQWERIWINESNKNSTINYAIIKNAFVGIEADYLFAPGTNNLTINNTIIENASNTGLLARHFNITGENNVIANCGVFAVKLSIGGSYDFKQCTFADYWNYSIRKSPLLYLANNEKLGSTLNVGDLTKANFSNCIIYGNIDNEIGFDSIAGGLFKYNFDHCLLKIDPAVKTRNGPLYQDIIKNLSNTNDSIIFKDYRANNYELSNNSAAIGKGTTSISVPYDITGKPRNSPTDLGAYAK
jgi:hypothetical protein